jgi:fumarylacetoacetate (FAA) hydrolase
MKLVTYLKEEREQLGVLINGMLYDMEVLHPELPNSMNMMLNYWEEFFPFAQAGELMLREGTRTSSRGIPISEAQLLAPIPFPTSCRDGYAFRQHVARQDVTAK